MGYNFKINLKLKRYANKKQRKNTNSSNKFRQGGLIKS